MSVLIYVKTPTGRPAAQKWSSPPSDHSDYWGKKNGLIVARFPLAADEEPLDLDMLDRRYRHRVPNTEAA